MTLSSELPASVSPPEVPISPWKSLTSVSVSDRPTPLSTYCGTIGWPGGVYCERSTSTGQAVGDRSIVLNEPGPPSLMSVGLLPIATSKSLLPLPPRTTSSPCPVTSVSSPEPPVSVSVPGPPSRNTGTVTAEASITSSPPKPSTINSSPPSRSAS